MNERYDSLIIFKKSGPWKQPLSYRIELKLFYGENLPPVFFIKK